MGIGGSGVEAVNELALLVDSRYPVIAVDTVEEDRLEGILRRLAARLGVPLYIWTVTRGLQRIGADAPIYDTQAPANALANVAALREEGLFHLKDLQRFLDDAAVVRGLQDISRAFSRDRRAIVISGPGLTLPPAVAKIAARFALSLPDERELAGVARATIDALGRRHDIRIDLGRDGFKLLVRGLIGFTRFEAERALTEVVLDDLVLDSADVGKVVRIKKERLERDGVLEFVPLEEGGGELGGMSALKEWLSRRREAFGDEARRFGLPAPKGIVLLGVQGCGKSFAARVVARQWNLPLLRLEPGRLYDKYVGETEAKLERALGVAERMSPCVLLVDEIEKGLAAGGSGDADGGLSRRVLGRLLGWLQDRPSPVFVVATCNRIADLPPEVLRKGRFDEIFFVDLPDVAERSDIFTIHLRRRDRDPGTFDLAALADATPGFSGAEIEQVVVAGMYAAFADRTDLTTQHLLAEAAATRPLSVTRSEEIEALRAWARGRTVPASG